MSTTLQQLQEYLAVPAREYVPGYSYKDVLERIQCADGYTLSVQASKYHCCTPRDDIGPYTEVEVWYCGEVPELSEYGDGTDPLDYVPIELVVQLIDRHGGMTCTPSQTVAAHSAS